MQTRIEDLCREAFGSHVSVSGEPTDISQGRGTFSEVFSVALIGDDWDENDDRCPQSVAVKLPTEGPNRAAAIDSGAYEREAVAYRLLLADTPISVPVAYLVSQSDDGTSAFVLEDLSKLRRTDQLDGLVPDDAAVVAESLEKFHRHWSNNDDEQLQSLPIRRNTIAGLPEQGLRDGLRCLTERWTSVLNENQIIAFRRLVDGRRNLAQMYERLPATLCHGDPRADNLVFDDRGGPVLFDWQQVAVQFGEADLAWLLSTSLTTETRRNAEVDLVREVFGHFDRYRLGLALPGLAVLLLAQREPTNEQSKATIGTSLQRIAAAICDLEVDRISREGNPPD